MNLFDTLPKIKTDEEKHVFEVADFFRELNIKSRREGILALAEYCEDKEIWKTGSKEYPAEFPTLSSITPYELETFYMLLRLVLNGADPEVICDVAKYSIASSNEVDGAQLALMVGVEAIRAIQASEHDSILCTRLAAMMGYPFGTVYYKTRYREKVL